MSDEFLNNHMSRRHMVTLCIGGVSAAVLGFGAEDALAKKAKKKAPTRYEIIYVLNGGTQAEGQKRYIKVGGEYSAENLMDPKRRGYTFKGWFSDEYFEEPLVTLFGVKKAAKRTAYAEWKKNKYTITYNWRDSHQNVTTLEYTVTTPTFEHEDPTRLGWQFEGWYDEDFVEKSELVKKGTIGNKTLYAKWGLKEWWKKYLTTMIPKIEERADAVASNGESFVFLTDVHISSSMFCSVPAIRKIWSEISLDYVFCGGDILNSHSTRDYARYRLEMWQAETSFAPVKYVRGNHDNNNESANYAIPENQFTDDEIAPFLFPHLVDETGSVKETITDGGGSAPSMANAADYNHAYTLMRNTPDVSTLYTVAAAKAPTYPSGMPLQFEKRQFCYVVDNQEQKIRHIVLDTGAPLASTISDAQLGWMQRRIKELASGWTVLIFAHQFFQTSNIDHNGVAIMRALDAIYDSCSARIAAVISGHVHKDLAYRSPKGYVVVACTTDAYKKTTDSDNELTERGAGVNRHAFDIVHVDTKKRTLYFQRLGYGDDRMFKY